MLPEVGDVAKEEVVVERRPVFLSICGPLMSPKHVDRCAAVGGAGGDRIDAVLPAERGVLHERSAAARQLDGSASLPVSPAPASLAPASSLGVTPKDVQARQRSPATLARTLQRRAMNPRWVRDELNDIPHDHDTAKCGGPRRDATEPRKSASKRNATAHCNRPIR
jgi:hypothetical protein